MKVHFYRRSDDRRNFGDELNNWLWKRIIPELLDDNGETVLLGIGTLINDQIEKKISGARNVIVFTTGVGYGSGLPKDMKNWIVYCVRGPLSAYRLNLPLSYGIGDGALLINKLYEPGTKKRHRFSYMPHFTQSIVGDESWRAVCGKADVNYIDARWSVDRVLLDIAQSEVLITEAMHGAIVAEALRVPWISVHTDMRGILPFKWLDWCESIGVNYDPSMMMMLRNPEKERGTTGFPNVKSFISKYIRRRLKQRIALGQLLDIAASREPVLGDESQLKRIMSKLDEKLDMLKNDFAKGRFN